MAVVGLVLGLAVPALGTPSPSASAGGADAADEPGKQGSIERRSLGGPDLEDWLDGQPADPAPLPHLYGKVELKGAPRLDRVTTLKESKQIALALAGKGSWPRVVKQKLEGVFFVAVDGEQEEGGRRFYRTVDGRFLRLEDVKLLEPPRMHGELLGTAVKLPLAFVYGEDRPVYELTAGRLVDRKVAKKHSRFQVHRTFSHEGHGCVEGPNGMVLPADAVRIARAVKRPDKIPAGEKWIHVDLSEQSLVAYESDRPVLATLVSSGRKGYEPPTGVFRVRIKMVKTTMDGPDPTEGWYEVQEVPWTLYYHKSYAIHGTYWHDTFGEVRSHGCTNIAPADARWLFAWTEPTVPGGAKSIWATGTTGTYVYFTE